MPDRFDLTKPEELSALFRITDDYCRLVNPERLTPADVERLERGRSWLEAMVSVVPDAMDDGYLTSPVLDNPASSANDARISAIEALDLFRTANDEARVVAERLLVDHKKTISFQGGRFSHLSIAQHLARVSNLSSVDRNWVWDSS